MNLKAKIAVFIKGKQISQVIKNFLSLSVIQGLDMFLPLLTVPYLIRVIGVENVGLLAFVNAVIGYFGIFMNYGFSLTATKEISQHIDDADALQRIFNVVFTAKNYLVILSFLLLVLLLLTIPSMAEYAKIYILTFGTIVFLNISPTWYYQGIQKMKFLTYTNIIFKLFFTIMIFLFVKEKVDFWMVPAFTFIGAFVSCAISIIYVVKIYGIKIKRARTKEVLVQYDSGKYIFLSQIKISFFNNFNILIIGTFLGNTSVGIFSSADKIVKVLSAVQIPIVTALYPFFSKLIIEDKKLAFDYIKKLAIYGGLFYLVPILCVYIFAENISILLFGNNLTQIPMILRIMVFIPVLVFLNNLFGTQILLNLGKDRIFFKILLIAAAINVCLIYPLIHYAGIYGAGISILLTELFVCLGMLYYMNKEKNKII